MNQQTHQQCGPLKKLRSAIQWLVQWKYFEYLIMCLIVSNSLLIAAYDYSDRASVTQRNITINQFMFAFQIMFVIECVLKIIAMGFVLNENSYLRNGWNIIDFIVIVLGQAFYFAVNASIIQYRVIDMATNQTNLKSLRTLRVLLPLRNITQYEKLKHLATTLVKSLPNFGNVSVFLVIIFIIFGTFGLHMHNDSFYWRCRTTELPVTVTNDDGTSTVKWEIDPSQSQTLCSPTNLGMYQCKAGTFCGNPYKQELNGDIDGVFDEAFINYGVLTFDNIGKSLLSIFQILTNDNWALTMYNLMNVDFPLISTLYMCLLVIFGSFFLINIILAVILDSFIQVQQEYFGKVFEDQHDDPKKLVIQSIIQDKVQQAEEESQRVLQQIEEEEEIFTSENYNFNEPEPEMMGPIDESKNEEQLKQMQEIREKKDFIRDTLKQDIDFFKETVLFKEKPPGTIRRLAAIKRTLTNVVVDKTLERQQSFKKNLKFLRSISMRKKQGCIKRVSIQLAQSRFFIVYFIPGIIFLNTAILSAERYPQDHLESDILEKINFCFFFIFLFEIFVKMNTVGITAYFRDGYNILDSILLGIGSIDTILNIYLMSSSNHDESKGSNVIHQILSALRGFRLFRIFKLASTWKKFGELLKTILNTLKDISTFSIFLFLFSFIYSLLGLELFAFGCKKSPDDKIDMVNGVSPLNNFDSFYESFLTMFVLLTGDQWTSIMLDYYRAVSPTLALIFFVTFMVLGQYMLFNLFLAILLQNFDEDSIEQEMQKKLLKQKQIEKELFKKRIEMSVHKIIQKVFKCCIKKADKGIFNSDQDSLDIENFRYVDKEKSKKKVKGFLKKINHDDKKESGQIKGDFKLMEGVSLYIFSIENPLRRIFYLTVHKTWFEYFILLVITISTVQIAVDSQLHDPEGSLDKTIKIIDIVTTVIFSLEMLMKIIAFGIIFNGENSFLQSPSNVLDFVVTILSIMSSLLNDANLGVFKVLRLFKIMRPLRFITRIAAFQLAIKALINAVTNVINVLVISVLFYLILGIVGVNQFMGQFSYCILDHTSWTKVRETGELFYKQDCLNYGGEWVNRALNFDNIFDSMMTLFQMSTLSDWLNVMYDGMSITGIESDFKIKAHPYAAIYFVIFVIVGAFFILNLFVGVVISTYNREKEKIAKDFLLKERQKEWLYANEIIFRQKLQIVVVKHQNKFRNLILKIYQSPKFEAFILIMIFFNTVVLMIKQTGQPLLMTQITQSLNYFFLSIFTLEFFIKMIALGKFYFKESWNVYDFIVIILTYSAIIIDQYTEINFGPQATLLRSIKLMKMFKYFKRTQNLKIMFQTFIITLPAMGSIGGLLALLVYVYAVLGVSLFAEVKRIAPMDEVQNFQSFGSAFLILIKIATGDGWAELMNNLRMSYSILNQCIEDPTYQDYQENGYQSIGCGSSRIAVMYFYSYLLIVKLLFLNLFIAVILEGFETVNVQESRTLNSTILDHFKQVWGRFDTQATGFIKIYDLPLLLNEIGQPLGWQKGINEEEKQEFIKSLKLSIYNQFQDYLYVDVILALCRKLLISDDIQKNLQSNPLADPEEIRLRIEKDLQELEENDEDISTVKKIKKKEKQIKEEQKRGHTGNVFTARHEEAARLLISHLRFFVQAKRLAKGLKIRRYTKEELEEIDAKLMEKFRQMVEVDEPEQVPQPNLSGLNEVSARDSQTHGNPFKQSQQIDGASFDLKTSNKSRLITEAPTLNTRRANIEPHFVQKENSKFQSREQTFNVKNSINEDESFFQELLHEKQEQSQVDIIINEELQAIQAQSLLQNKHEQKPL